MAITLAVAGARSSYLDSEALSPIPFRNMPFQTQQTKKIVDPKQTVVLTSEKYDQKMHFMRFHVKVCHFGLF